MSPQDPASPTIRIVKASVLPETPKGYSGDFVEYSATPAPLPASTPTSPNPSKQPHDPYPPQHLEIAPQARSRIVEMEEAIQIVYTTAYYTNSFETEDETDDDSDSIPGPSQPRTASRAAIYLRSYLRHAELPEIHCGGPYYRHPLSPFVKESERNLLNILPNRNRMISQIRKFPKEIFNKATNIYLHENVYGVEDFLTLINTGIPDCTEDEALTLKASINKAEYIYPESKVSLWCPKNLGELIKWIDCYPLQTLTRAIHLANPSTTQWWFERVLPADLGEDFVKNRRMLAVLNWRFHPTQSRPIWFREVEEEIGWVVEGEKGLDFFKVHPNKNPWFTSSPGASVAVIIQPPWILGWTDFENIANCQELPELTDPSTNPSKHYTIAQRVWCQIRDACQKLNTKFFILTTYEGWLFGKFGGGRGGSGYIPDPGNIQLQDSIPDSMEWEYRKIKIAPWAFDQWSYVETSDLLGSEVSNPSIMQFLYFWVARSMGLKKSRELPLEIRLTDEEISMMERPTTELPIQTKPPRLSSTYHNKSEFQHHTGNRPRAPRPSNRFAPYSQRPSRSTTSEKEGPILSTGLFAFVKNIARYFSGAIDVRS